MKTFLRQYWQSIVHYQKRGILFKYFLHHLFGSYKILRQENNQIFVRTRSRLLFKVPVGADYLYALNPLTEMLVDSYLDIHEGIFIDVGAYIGTHTIKMAKQGVKTIAIEPNPVSYKILQENITINGVAEKVVLVNKALHLTNGESMSFMDDYSTSRLVSAQETLSKPTIKVTTISFASLLTSCNIVLEDVRCVKIDVEGFELTVLKSMEAFFRAHRNHLKIICEILLNQENKLEIMEYMKNLGFSAQSINVHNYIFRKPRSKTL